ncbi:DUF3159 domain-containing protein, partial [Microbacterium sp. GbtcB4]|uniref:DUF3159 domain-containing protein n=1 Tax=Microbacterium sp. GbtcB4 TaxID=2824749 RepID=UPI0020C74064
MAGSRAIVESLLPSLAFVILFTLRPVPLLLPLGVSVGLAAGFTVVRLVQGAPPWGARGGLVGVG